MARSAAPRRDHLRGSAIDLRIAARLEGERC
ncbi:hypothetical protein SCE1572_27930 [Sorangium cellulosum So0157-2]|uniref:Uncharacterized protein n=1 Tax=Sorangium cellulosum So0157-2 TaxID=1254432 RepID=S4Y0F2_SORCE|nr:hypothetical protein SCE1572_27930 [Sorangium cellulosum So0157-2]